MLFYFPGTMGAGKQLHRRYGANPVRGEWFTLTEDEIETLKNTYAPTPANPA